MPRSSYPKGANKALRRMRKRYGKKRGTSIFYARANKLGRGKTRLQKIRSVYSKGAKIRRRRRR